MTEAEIEAVTQRCLLFRNLALEEREAVIAAGRLLAFNQGEFLLHQGDEATIMYVLLSGRVKLTQVSADGDQVIVNYFEGGDGLGIIVALSDMPYPLSAEAIISGEALLWSREQMRALMLRYPQLALNGLDMIGRRFARLQTRYQEMATERVEQRLARALLRLVRQFGKRIEEGVLIDMALTRQDLAQMTGTNLYNVSRIMSKWEQLGYVGGGHKQVILRKAHELVAIAEDLPSPGISENSA